MSNSYHKFVFDPEPSPWQIFSERWISDSVSSGRSMNLADYAKHGEFSPLTCCTHVLMATYSFPAPIGWNIDDPSLYLPCPFPPIYHSVLNNQLVTPDKADHLVTPIKADQPESWQHGRRDIHSLPILGPYLGKWVR